MTDGEIGRIIRELRTGKGMSQLALARKLGVTWEMVSRYERGKSSALQKLFELADALEVDVSRFFGVDRANTNFADASTEYVTSRFVPVITSVPADVQALSKLLNQTEAGMRYFDDGAQIEKFGVRLGVESKVRVASGVLLPKGVLICTLSLAELSEQSLVLVVRNGLVSIEQYLPNEKVTVLARVVEWVVKF